MSSLPQSNATIPHTMVQLRHRFHCCDTASDILVRTVLCPPLLCRRRRRSHQRNYSHSSKWDTINTFPPNVPQYCPTAYLLPPNPSSYISFVVPIVSPLYHIYSNDVLPLCSPDPSRPPVPNALRNRDSRAPISSMSGVCIPIGGTLLPFRSGNSPPLSWAADVQV